MVKLNKKVEDKGFKKNNLSSLSSSQKTGSKVKKKENGTNRGNTLRMRTNSGVLGRALLPSESKVLEDPSEQFDYFYKFIIIGDELVGKTNLMLRIAKGAFQKKPKTTYGVEFALKSTPLPNSNQTVRA